MVDQRRNVAADHFRRSRELLERAEADQELIAVILASADRIGGALRQNNKLLIAGNGGSAADAQHIAAEFLSRFAFDRAPLPAIALTTDTSVLTAIGNDYGFDRVFERQVRGLGRRGDVLLAISTSGRSPNVLAALHAANEIGITTIGFTGANGGTMRGLCQLCLVVPSDETAMIQQVHLVAAHALCTMVERDLFESSSELHSYPRGAEAFVADPAS